MAQHDDFPRILLRGEKNMLGKNGQGQTRERRKDSKNPFT